MQGTVLRVLVEVGQEVAAGDVVCIVEAMKMENEVAAHQPGTVRELHVARARPSRPTSPSPSSPELPGRAPHLQDHHDPACAGSAPAGYGRARSRRPGIGAGPQQAAEIVWAGRRGKVETSWRRTTLPRTSRAR